MVYVWKGKEGNSTSMDGINGEGRTEEGNRKNKRGRRIRLKTINVHQTLEFVKRMIFFREGKEGKQGNCKVLMYARGCFTLVCLTIITSERETGKKGKQKEKKKDRKTEKTIRER